MLKKLLISIFIMSSLCLQAAQEQLINTTPEVIETESGWNTYRTNIEQSYTCCSCSNKITSFYYVGCVHDNTPLLCIDCKQACLSEEQKSTCVSMFGHSDQNVEDIKKDLKQALFKTASSHRLEDLYAIIQRSFPIMLDQNITTFEYVTGLTGYLGNTLLMEVLRYPHKECQDACKKAQEQYKNHEYLSECEPNYNVCSLTACSYVAHLIEHSSHEQLMHKNQLGYTPLIIALKYNHYELAQKIIEASVKDRIMILLSQYQQIISIPHVARNENEVALLDGLEQELKVYQLGTRTTHLVKSIMLDRHSPLHKPIRSILQSNVVRQARNIFIPPLELDEYGSYDRFPRIHSQDLKNILPDAIRSNNIPLAALLIRCGLHIYSHESYITELAEKFKCQEIMTLFKDDITFFNS